MTIDHEGNTRYDLPADVRAQAAAVNSTNAYASGAFGFSLVGAVGLSVICAIAALCQIKTAQDGRGLAIAGLGRLCRLDRPVLRPGPFACHLAEKGG